MNEWKIRLSYLKSMSGQLISLVKLPLLILYAFKVTVNQLRIV